MLLRVLPVNVQVQCDLVPSARILHREPGLHASEYGVTFAAGFQDVDPETPTPRRENRARNMAESDNALNEAHFYY
jgi:hypothetical protein